MAFWSTDETFQQMYEAGYDMNVYFKNAADFNGTQFLKFLARNSNNGELNTDFDSLRKQILDKISKGSSVVDYMGQDFDFVNDPAKMSIKIGDETLAPEKTADNTYGFGKLADGSYRFVLNYLNDEDGERITLDINETILPSKAVTLEYSEKLVNVPTQTGTYTFKTNESATLNPVDGNGKEGKREDFPVPEITYEYRKPVVEVTFNNEDVVYANAKVEKGQSISKDTLADESMPKNPSKNGYTFKEWNTQKNGKGTKFTGDTIVNQDITVYAVYSLNMVPIETPPTLELRDKTITVGEELDERDLIVKAEDSNGKDLRNAVELVDNGGFDNTKAGKYTFTFKVTDKGGASVTKKATVTVVEKDKPTPKPPQVSLKKIFPKTGDNADATLSAVLMGLSGALLVAVGLRKRRKES